MPKVQLHIVQIWEVPDEYDLDSEDITDAVLSDLNDAIGIEHTFGGDHDYMCTPVEVLHVSAHIIKEEEK